MKAGPLPQTITGVGLGLRSAHIPNIINLKPQQLWFEVLTDNYLNVGGQLRKQLETIAESYLLAMHGVGLSLGSTDPINWDYVKQLKIFAQTYAIKQISEHCCFTSFGGHQFHDLVPIPFTEEAVNHIATRIRQVQDYLEQTILIENVSSYYTILHSTLSEGEFITAVSEEADCHILLDVNNAWVNQANHGYSAKTMISQLPSSRIKEIHLAGYEDKGTHLIDTHNSPISEVVWNLYEWTLQQLGAIPTLIEWDKNLPTWAILFEQHQKAQLIMQRNLSRATLA